MKSLLLKPGRDRSLMLHHPWIFSGAIAQVQGKPEQGETVAVRAPQGNFLAYAAFSQESKIAARVWSWDEADTVDADFLRRRLQASLELRRALVPTQETNALRLVHAESDGLPGLVVDRYADLLVIQCLSTGAERWRDTLVGLLCDLTGIHNVYERSDVEVRTLEGLPHREGWLQGDGELPPFSISENGLRFLVDPAHGQKTGFYIDQRRNRQRLRDLSAGKNVLNCFCYTGGFSVYARAGGAASVLSIDSSRDALELARTNMRLNGLDSEGVEWLEADVFQALRTLRDQGKVFDLVVLDPPKFAPTAAQVERAARGYKDINLLALKLLRPGGLLFTFSCSGGITPELFQKIVTGAALDAGVEVEVVETLTQGLDHPVALTFPEGAYLKGLICYVRQ
ncbi:MAG: class I SAM-dependent rRNA methyltransferase [Anaerolineaceae bacterium]|nr:class I SAM-dependent rRNA methyltransferase [Anaerolineaceae bacterium]